MTSSHRSEMRLDGATCRSEMGTEGVAANCYEVLTSQRDETGWSYLSKWEWELKSTVWKRKDAVLWSFSSFSPPLPSISSLTWRPALSLLKADSFPENHFSPTTAAAGTIPGHNHLSLIPKMQHCDLD